MPHKQQKWQQLLSPFSRICDLSPPPFWRCRFGSKLKTNAVIFLLCLYCTSMFQCYAARLWMYVKIVSTETPLPIHNPMLPISLQSYAYWVLLFWYQNAERNTYVVPKHDLWSSASQYPISNTTAECLQTISHVCIKAHTHTGLK